MKLLENIESEALESLAGIAAEAELAAAAGDVPLGDPRFYQWLRAVACGHLARRAGAPAKPEPPFPTLSVQDLAACGFALSGMLAAEAEKNDSLAAPLGRVYLALADGIELMVRETDSEGQTVH